MSRAALAMVLVAAGAAPALGEPAAPAAPAPLRRLEAVQLGVAHHVHYVDFSPKSGTSPTLSLEAGRFVDPAIGFSAFVRGQYYTEDDDDEFTDSAPRFDVLFGARAYVQPADRMLAAFGAGLLVTRYRFIDTRDTATQKFVEVYAGWTALRSRCTELEAGVNLGYSPDEEYIWIGLAVGARRRMW
jgi:hypothetical protein